MTVQSDTNVFVGQHRIPAPVLPRTPGRKPLVSVKPRKDPPLARYTQPILWLPLMCVALAPFTLCTVTAFVTSRRTVTPFGFCPKPAW